MRTELPLDALSPFQVAKHKGGMNPDDRNAGEKHKDWFHGYSFSSGVMSSAAVKMAPQIEGEGVMRIRSPSRLSIRRMLYGGKLRLIRRLSLGTFSEASVSRLPRSCVCVCRFMRSMAQRMYLCLGNTNLSVEIFGPREECGNTR